jgi:urease accessory protein UreE
MTDCPLIERVLGNVFDGEDATMVPPDLLPLSWDECLRRALRGRTRGGRDVRLLLPPGLRLRHGDVLLRSASGAVLLAVDVKPCELLRARPGSVGELAALAYELGNLHAPVQILDANALLTIPDGPIEALLGDLNLPYAVTFRRFEPRHAGGPAVRSYGVELPSAATLGGPT